MAELSYGDIQRAVREAIQSLQANVQRLSSNVGVVSSRSDHIEFIETTLRDMQRNMQQMQINLNAMRLNGGTSDPRITQIMQEIAELKGRFATIERYISQSGEYIRLKIEEENEDREYRNP